MNGSHPSQTELKFKRFTGDRLKSYDAVIEDAAARNHTFLEILKKDIKEAHEIHSS